MRTYTTFAVAAIAAVVSVNAAALVARQNPPACFLPCIASSAGSIGCSPNDAQCLCSSTAFINTVAVCFAKQCNSADAQTGTLLGQQLCAQIGISVTIPAAAASALASGSTGVSGSGAGTTSSRASSSAASSSVTSSSSRPASSSSAAPAAPTSAPSSSAAPASAAAPASTSTKPNNSASSLVASGALAGLAVIGAVFAAL